MVPSVRIVTRPASPAGVIAPEMCSLYGDCTPVTQGIVSRSSMAASTAARTCASSIVAGACGTTNIVADRSAACGKVILSWSMATCDGAPGISKVSSNAPPKPRARPG